MNLLKRKLFLFIKAFYKFSEKLFSLLGYNVAIIAISDDKQATKWFMIAISKSKSLRLLISSTVKTAKKVMKT